MYLTYYIAIHNVHFNIIYDEIVLEIIPVSNDVVYPPKNGHKTVLSGARC